MAPVGPQLPSSNGEKRKRHSDGGHGDTSGSDSDIGPAPPSQEPEPVVKKARVIGPSLPPPSNPDELPVSHSGSSDESDDDDTFGPSLPPNGSEAVQTLKPAISGPEPTIEPASSSKRDDWMLVPPTSGDWSARADPTKIKSRKFASGKGPKAPSTGGNASDAWHETPQEKQARLQREMMGIKDTSIKPAAQSAPVNKIDAETAKRLKEYKKSRGPTLYEAHQGADSVEKDDDPSARAFDREKDIGGGLQINATQRRDLVKKAADFDSRFSSARYL